MLYITLKYTSIFFFCSEHFNVQKLQFYGTKNAYHSKFLLTVKHIQSNDTLYTIHG